KPELLISPKKIELSQNYNANMEVQPKESPVSGKSYTIDQLIEYMIKYSDNAGFNLLFARSGTDNELRDIFDDLDLFYPYDQALVKDVWTAQEYSRFLRLLYNSTYLNESDSEKALKLLSESEYD